MGVMAQLVTNCRPAKTPIFAITFDNRLRRQLFLNRGVKSHRIKKHKDPEENIKQALQILEKLEGLKKGDQIVLVSDVITTAGIDAIQLRKIQ